MKTKICTKCGERKSVSKFSKSALRQDGTGRVGDGRIGQCNQCRWRRRKELRDTWCDQRKREASRRQQVHARKWDERNRHSVQARHCNHHAKTVGATGRLTAKQVASVWSEWDGLCWVCGTIADQIDHVQPINRKAGGTNTPDNIRPICKECNQKRSHKWHGMSVAEKEAGLLRQIKELLNERT